MTAMENTNKAVCALIINQTDKSRFLGISRRDNREVFGLIGGKVDPGESLEEAIVREVKEETGFDFFIEANVFTKLCRGEKDFVVTTFSGIISHDLPTLWRNEANEEGVVKWCSKAELLAGPFGIYNRELFNQIGI